MGNSLMFFQVNMGVDLMNVVQVKVPEVNETDGAVPSAIVKFLVPETAIETRPDPARQRAWHRSTSRLKWGLGKRKDFSRKFSYLRV